MKTITNPILKGFNPDPCMIKGRDRYYIAVSSFEWLPGVRVYESKDLVNWSYTTDLLQNQIDLKGNPRGCSIWAPNISYHDNQYYLIYTDVKGTAVPFKDCHNYLRTAKEMTGPWSEPIYLNSSGFDPALFHDEDGKKWIVNEVWDYRMLTRNRSAGIVLQEYDVQQQKVVGELYKIFDGTELAKTEAPQIYRHEGYYYLMTAEGGTGAGHSVTLCRSKQITGPYELDPHYPMLTSQDNADLALQCAGHASLVETEDHEWYIAHLCTRPIDGKYAILGRETALQKVVWDDEGWLRLKQGGHSPAVEVELPKNFKGNINEISHDFIDYFGEEKLNPEWNSLKIFADESWLQLEATSGLRILGGESPQSSFEQHLIAVRQKDVEFTAETSLTFRPKTYMEMAGLILYLNIENYCYAYLSHDEKLGTVIQIMENKGGIFSLLPKKIQLPDDSCQIRVHVNGIVAQFEVSLDKGENWQCLNEKQDISHLSGGFTGNFIGLTVNNMDKFNDNYADFDYFKYLVK